MIIYYLSCLMILDVWPMVLHSHTRDSPWQESPAKVWSPPVDASLEAWLRVSELRVVVDQASRSCERHGHYLTPQLQQCEDEHMALYCQLREAVKRKRPKKLWFPKQSTSSRRSRLGQVLVGNRNASFKSRKQATETPASSLTAGAASGALVLKKHTYRYIDTYIYLWAYDDAYPLVLWWSIVIRLWL